jgi:hypothetical protein
MRTRTSLMQQNPIPLFQTRISKRRTKPKPSERRAVVPDLRCKPSERRAAVPDLRRKPSERRAAVPDLRRKPSECRAAVPDLRRDSIPLLSLSSREALLEWSWLARILFVKSGDRFEFINTFRWLPIRVIESSPFDKVLQSSSVHS